MGQSLTLAQCLESVEECGAPVVTVTGGEPLLYPPVFELLQELVHRQQAHLSVHQRHPPGKSPAPSCPAPSA